MGSDRPSDSDPNFEYETEVGDLARPVVDIWTRRYVRFIPRDGEMSVCADCDMFHDRVICRNDHSRDEVLVPRLAHAPTPRISLGRLLVVNVGIALFVAGALWLIARH